jgi:hypothetical protein
VGPVRNVSLFGQGEKAAIAKITMAMAPIIATYGLVTSDLCPNGFSRQPLPTGVCRASYAFN